MPKVERDLGLIMSAKIDEGFGNEYESAGERKSVARGANDNTEAKLAAGILSGTGLTTAGDVIQHRPMSKSERADGCIWLHLEPAFGTKELALMLCFQWDRNRVAQP